MAINGITASVLATKYNRGDAADVQKYINSEGITQADVKAYFPDFDLGSLKGITVPTAAAATNNTLTNDIATNLMQRSMTTGAPTSEFDKYGGYEAVSSMYTKGGGQFDTSAISAADKAKYANTIANSGVGNLSLLKDTNTELTAAGRAAMLANGVTTMDAAALTKAGIPFQKNTDERLSDLSGQYSDLNKNYGLLSQQYGTLNTSYADLKKQLDALMKKSTASSSAASLTTGSGVVSTGATNTSGLGATPGASSTGAVYGPDGTAYPSPAAAIAAGVYNYTMFPPTTTGQPNGLVTNAMDSTSAAKLSGVTGNYYGGINQNPDNPWVNLYPTKA